MSILITSINHYTQYNTFSLLYLSIYHLFNIAKNMFVFCCFLYGFSLTIGSVNAILF
nr:MAG TPA: hypothetical protein [Caudoviricetes sp.]